MKKIVLYIFIILCINASSQTGNLVFNDTVLHELIIETDLPDWFATLENDFNLNLLNPDVYPEVYHSCKVSWDGIVINNCGFREKGNASNLFTSFGKKKPFKISFDEFVNQDLDGLKKINLNNFTNDPSLMHDVVCYKLFRDAGLMASRTSYTKLYVDGEYIGLYAVIENVDKTFLKFQFGSANNDGNLYKTDRNAAVPLNWQGYEPDPYKEQGLKLNTNESADDWSKLINFINLINNYQGADFKQQFENSFDVHAYLKILAIEKCVRSWDSYWGGGNNFYLYEHPDGKIRWIPWDMNETFQDIKLLSGTSLLEGYLVPSKQLDERPLLKRIFEYEEYRKEYLTNVCDLIHNQFTLDHLGPFVLDRYNLIDEAYKADTYKYNTYNAFINSLTDYNQDAVSITHSGYVLRINYPGIFPFIQSQREWAVEQMKGWGYSCSIEDNSIYNLFVYPNPANDFVNVSNEASGFEYAQFKLYDFMGRVNKTTDFELMQGSYTTFPLDGVPAGIYLLTKNAADGSIGRAKIIVK